MMRKILGLIGLIAAAGCGGLSCSAAAQPADPASQGWKLVFSDGFDGAGLDPAKWHVYQDCWGGGNKERECYTRRADNVSVHDGTLDIAAQFERASGPSLSEDLRTPGVEPPPATKPFTSGKISTKGTFSLTYGRVEVRAKLPTGQGTWPAIWLLPNQDLYGPWPGSGEIDVMEAVNLGVKCGSCVGGVENQIYGTLHYGSNMHHYQGLSQQKAFALPKGSEGDWHTFRVDWAPDDVTWYVDDRVYSKIMLKNWRDSLQKATPAPAIHNAPFDRPFYLILNLAIGGEWPESHDQGGVLLADYPKHMAVDWVHIYQCERATGCG
jgi:beta-glucanase (GH16 family)